MLNFNFTQAFFLAPKRIAFLSLLFVLAAQGELSLNLYTGTDVGFIEKGLDVSIKNAGDDINVYDPSGLFLNRNYVGISLSNQIDEKNQINIAIGGVFWKPYEKFGSDPLNKHMSFGPGIPYAYLNHKINDDMDISYGYLNYKYNHSSKHLGEYLFRTEAYPTIIYTGGWNWMNSASYSAFGVKYSWHALDKMINTDLVLFMEYFNTPIYDITPAYIGTFKPTKFITLGAAASLHRFLSPTEDIKDKITKTHKYHKNMLIPGRDNSATFTIDNNQLNMEVDVSWVAGSEIDSLAIRQDLYDQNPTLISVVGGYESPDEIPLSAKDVLEARADLNFTGLREDLKEIDVGAYNDSLNETSGYVPLTINFDNSALKLLSFFELDFAQLMGSDKEQMGEFNLYGEIALLGTKNYDIFYTKYNQRLVKMIGLSVPTFGLLDNLSLELEHLANPNSASIRELNSKEFSIVPDSEYRIDAKTGQPLSFDEDDLKWSLSASRGISENFKVFVMVANDHFRMKSLIDFAVEPMSIPVTNERDHFYWLTRIEWSM